MPTRVKAAPSATNPFRFGRIVSGDAFTDREADLLALERELRGGQNILIEAPRRFGKTSLILEVKRRLEAAGIPVAYLDCMLVPSRARLADRLASAYLDAFKNPAQRAVVQHQQHVAYAFLGSRQALPRRAVHERNAPLLKMARPYPLGPLPREEFANFLMARFRVSGRPLPKDAVYALIDFTGAHPNDTQEAAHFLWEVALLPLSTKELVSTAISRVLDAEAAQMTVLWHDSAPAQRNLLVALVEWGGRNIYREDYRRRANLGPATTVQRAIQTLIDRELVDMEPTGAYTIKERFFEEWIRRRIIGGEL